MRISWIASPSADEAEDTRNVLEGRPRPTAGLHDTVRSAQDVESVELTTASIGVPDKLTYVNILLLIYCRQSMLLFNSEIISEPWHGWVFDTSVGKTQRKSPEAA